MRLKRLEIRNYKSLRDVAIEPTPLSVFVGPNGAGKTNLADAIDFLGQTYRWNLESAVLQKGGYENICYRDVRRSMDPIRFRIIVETISEIGIGIGSVNIENGDCVRLDHLFEFRAESQEVESPFFVSSEDMVAYSYEGKGRGIWNLSRKYGPEEVSGTELMLSRIPWYFAEIRRLRVFQLNPRSCRESGVPTPNPDLDRFGGNLPAAVAYLKKGHPDHFSAILETIRRINPAIEDIEIGFTHNKTQALFIKEKGVSRPWTSEDISDGTIQTIALLTAVFDPRNSLVVIEEPENSVHPWALRNLVEAFRAASEKKQILLTTHSPILIDQLKPEEVWVVRKPETETKIDPLLSLDPSLKEAWGQGKFTLSEYLDSGAVPEAVPAAGL